MIRNEPHPLYQGTEEPPLSEVLRDPIILRLMERDSVQMGELLRIIRAARRSGADAEQGP